MSNESFELQQYLDSSRAAGSEDGEGRFMLAGTQAIQSLAKYTFPFRGAWVLKLIQSVVASGVPGEIDIRAKRNQTTLYFRGEIGWSLSELGSALTEPTFQGHDSLLHALVSLRSVGFGEKVPFLVTQEGEGEALAWDGGELNFRTAPKGLSGTAFTVSTTEGVKACLQERAFSCPIPLMLNGDRLDAYENDPHHGWASRSQLLAIGFIDDGPPTLRTPQDSGREPKSGYDVHSELAAITKPFRSVPKTQAAYSFVFLLAGHLTLMGGAGHQKRRKVELHERRPRLNWVLDGVVIQSEEISSSPEPCSLGIFLSAQGLKTDASTLHLVETPEKAERGIKAQAAVKSRLIQSPIVLDWAKRQSEANRKSRVAGAAFGFMGLLMIAAEPVMGSLLVGGGVAAIFLGGKELRAELDSIKASMARLSKGS